ncbi:uncharacterized protein LOC108036209 [Drosophila biarmipes]|uniref:uncharacterized protein LOC108036209 n=1 Tax=Drosophila biarmipes TaxID=125945 RepID=UPI0007E80DD3|nr:uncharacterized protein LOC108036209 [Drosophila biarmipes]
MNRGLVKIWQLLFLLECIKNSMEAKYEFVMEDENIFTACTDEAPETLDIKGLFDFSNNTFDMNESGVTLSGNKTVIWDIQPSDRVELAASILYFDRGTWQPTTLNLKVKDFCKAMFDKNQLWYDAYSKHIINTAEIKEKCFRVKGAVIMLETYSVDFIMSTGFPLKNGRYTIRFRYTAFDANEVKRPNEICFEIKGVFNKLNK